MNCTKIQSSIDKGIVESLDAQTQQLVDAHLVECDACRAFALEVNNVVVFASRRTAPAQSKEYWDSYYDKLVNKINDEESALIPRQSVSGDWFDWLKQFIPRQKPAMQFAMIAAVLVIGILIGKVLFDNDPASPPQQVAGSAGEELPSIQLTSLDDRTDRFLDRSKVLLLGMVNMDLDETTAEDVDLSQTRFVAQELVKESGPLRGELEDADQQRLMKLIDDLEVILLQIANLEEDTDIPAIEMVKDGVDQRAVLLKINVSEMRSRQRTDGS